jgi:hypothetical protein
MRTHSFLGELRGKVEEAEEGLMAGHSHNEAWTTKPVIINWPSPFDKMAH